MNGTAIMQVIAAIFVAGVAGYEVTPANIALIAILALMSSIGTPAARRWRNYPFHYFNWFKL